MYALILVVAVLSPATTSVTPVGVTSHIVGRAVEKRLAATLLRKWRSLKGRCHKRIGTKV